MNRRPRGIWPVQGVRVSAPFSTSLLLLSCSAAVFFPNDRPNKRSKPSSPSFLPSFPRAICRVTQFARNRYRRHRRTKQERWAAAALQSLLPSVLPTLATATRVITSNCCRRCPEVSWAWASNLCLLGACASTLSVRQWEPFLVTIAFTSNNSPRVVSLE